MSVKQVAIRLKSEGESEVLGTLGKIDKALDGMGAAGAASADRLTAAADREVAALLEVANAAKQAETALQQQINKATGVSVGGNARASQSARTLGAADDIYDRKARELLAQINPLGAAQDRLNRELAEYDSLARRGKISTEQLAQAQALARKRFEETERVLTRNTNGLSRNEMASRLNLSRQAADVAVTAAMGMNPAMIAMQQGPQILDAWATSGLKLNGTLVLLGGALTVLAGAAAASSVAFLQAEASYWSLERAATGLGRTAKMSAEEVRAAAAAGAEAAEISVGAAEKQAAAYLSTGRIGGEILTGLIALSKDYAAFTGKDAKEATEALAEAFANPADAAREMTRQFGLMDQETLKTIDSLMKQGDRLAAQKLLLEALTGAVEGHAGKVSDISSMWDAATVAMANYWNAFGQWLYEDPSERLAKLEQRANGNRPGRSSNFGLDNDRERGNAYFDWSVEVIRQGLADIVGDMKADQAAKNQQAQLEEDEKDKPKKGPRGKSTEQLAREALARARREEDVQANLNLEVARLTEDYDTVRRLESEARIRTRIRQLIDDGTSAEQARVKATEEENRLIAAQEVARGERALEMQRQGEMEVMKLLGEERSLRNLQDRISLEKLVTDFQKIGYDLAAATNLAEAERNRIIAARAEAIRRSNEEAERQHQLNLARLSGNEEMSRYLEIEDRIERRAREIERRNGWNHGEGTDQAMSEIQQELNAEAIGARKTWIRGLLGDIKNGGIAEALANQLDKATDHWLDKLTDSLAQLDWGGFLQSLFGGFGGGGSGGGFGNAFGVLFGEGLGKGSDAMQSHGEGNEWWRGFFGGHSTGTDFSDGGWKWVGERGPELVRLPRGTQVMEHNRSMAFARSQSAGGLTIGKMSIHNHASEPVNGEVSMTPEGDLELVLYPMVERSLAKAGRKGSLGRAMKQTPQTKKR